MTCEKHYWYHGPLVDCPHCEIDRLRTELEDKNKLLDSCSMQLNETASERNSLRAELARRPTDVLCLGKHGQITVLTDCPECVKEELAKAQEENARLQSSLSEQYVKGMEEAATLAEVTIDVPRKPGQGEYRTGPKIAATIRASIAELKEREEFLPERDDPWFGTKEIKG